MSTTAKHEINWYLPRNLWITISMLFWTMVGMIPFYYYLREIEQLVSKDYQYVVLYVPIMTGFVLFLMEVMLTDYFWYSERRRQNRTFGRAALYSIEFVLFLFYFTYFFLITYGMDTLFPQIIGPYRDLPVTKLFLYLFFGLAFTVFVCVVMYTNQKSSFGKQTKRK